MDLEFQYRSVRAKAFDSEHVGCSERKHGSPRCWLVVGLIIGLGFVPRLSAIGAFAKGDALSGANDGVPDNATPIRGSNVAVRVYNYARMDGVGLATSEEIAGSIFARAGVDVVFVDCPLPRTHIDAHSACQTKSGASDLVLRILPRSMARKLRTPSEALGFALPCPDSEPACELTVFYSQVDDLARNGYRADRLLGYVIAHEMGHVLLGPGHSMEGIMRREWSRTELQRMSWGLAVGFTDEQARRMRSAALRRAEVVLASTAKLENY